jgi:protoporphyrinogen/coproporphyrinogen III oxidase
LKSVAIIGGGISGLAAALHLTEHRPGCKVTLFEASHRLGGVLQTEDRDGFLIEQSADMFAATPVAAKELCRRIGFEEQLIQPNESHRRAFVSFQQKLYPVPNGFALMVPNQIWPVLTSRLLSPLGKLRLLCELWVRKRDESSDESLASFARRRFGQQAYDRLIQPLVGGIYTADPEKLSMQATMRTFIDDERESGSIIRAVWRKQKAEASKAERSTHDARISEASRNSAGARYGQFSAPKQGMASLIAHLRSRLDQVDFQMSCAVQSIGTAGKGWTVKTNFESREFDGLILAVPAWVAAGLLQTHDPELATRLRQIEYAGVAIVVHAVRRSQLRRPLDGFGFVVPQIEKRPVIACSFGSVKFAGRAPNDMALLRTFVGGAINPDWNDRSDDETTRLVRNELRSILGMEDAPVWEQVVRWPRAMPQYHVGHLSQVAKIETLLEKWSGLELAGNAYHGVGIPACIESGEKAATRLLKFLGNGTKCDGD